MRKVSCKALGVVLKAAKRRKLPDDVLTAGLAYDLDYLANTKNHIEWDAFCVFLRNARTVWSFEELSSFNEAFMRSPMVSTIGVFARLLFTARDLFAWVQKRSVGGGAQLFSDCVKATYEHIGADTTVIRLEIQESYESSSEFFWMTRGAFIGMPRLVGAGDADVDMKIEDRVGTYRVRYKNKLGTLSSLVRILTWPFTVRAAARELQRTNEELQERFYELEDARSKLERQAMRLRTAHTVNELVQRDLDLPSTLEAVVGVLVGHGGFASAELRLAESGDRVTRGDGEHEAPVTRPLEGRGGSVIGEVTVVARRGADHRERNELLDFLLPTISMAVENAIYRVGLERLVEQRTTELASTVVQLRDAQGARERFFANISHEIRTPLSIILLAASDIDARAGSLLDARSRSGLGAVTESARKLVRLVDELLLLAAGQEGKLQVRPEPTDLSALIDSVIAAWRPMVEAAGLELVTTVAPSIVAQIDPVAIERVITNLISNAVKYTPRGGSVAIELAAEADHLRISVLDTGPGIDDDLGSRLFGRFERAESERRRSEGTGLGLSLAKQLVEAHGGTIAAVRRPTGGTELRVMLPSAAVVGRARDTAWPPAAGSGAERLRGERHGDPGARPVGSDDPARRG